MPPPPLQHVRFLRVSLTKFSLAHALTMHANILSITLCIYMQQRPRKAAILSVLSCCSKQSNARAYRCQESSLIFQLDIRVLQKYTVDMCYTEI